MAYTLDIGLALGGAQTGLTLKAQLVDTAGVNVGAEVTTGFVEIGVGNYLWHYAAFPDSHRGGVKFSTTAGVLKAFAALNPEEAENTDTKTSTRPTAQAIWDALTSALTTAGSVGKRIADFLDAAVSSRHASGAAVASVTGAVESVTGSVGSVAGAVGSVSGNVVGSVGSLAAQAKADVNAEVVDVLVTDTHAEPTVVPAATASLKDKIAWLFTLARNRFTQTATTATLRNDAETATIGTATVSDDGTTFVRNEWT